MRSIGNQIRVLKKFSLRAVSMAFLSFTLVRLYTSGDTICSLLSREEYSNIFPASCFLLSKFAPVSFRKNCAKNCSNFCKFNQVGAVFMCIFAKF